VQVSGVGIDMSARDPVGEEDARAHELKIFNDEKLKGP
jgi:hypothetical protein